MFSFEGYTIDTKTGVISFSYTLSHESESFSFTEKITIDPEKAQWEKVPASLYDSLSLILGISYWKLYCPKEIKTPRIALDEKQAAFWNTVYRKGLGEFFYKNNIDYREIFGTPLSGQSLFRAEAEIEVALQLPGQKGSAQDKVPNSSVKSLVLWGGGKDSIVTAELLKKEGKDFDLFTLNTSDIQKETAKILGKEPVVLKREIDPQLLELNKRPDIYNGHVPITFVYSATALLAALLYGYDAVITSCEESANYGNVEYLGETINHQWSKSLEFETMFADYIKKYITEDILYFSKIRKYKEIEVVEMFSKYPQYFSSFSSCNKNFTIAKTAKTKWCGECPKCAFVFSFLVLYLPKEKVTEIFGKNLFADRKLEKTYRELLGLEDIKPFDCVGTPEETKQAFELARAKGEYKEDAIMKTYENIRA